MSAIYYWEAKHAAWQAYRAALDKEIARLVQARGADVPTDFDRELDVLWAMDPTGATARAAELDNLGLPRKRHNVARCVKDAKWNVPRPGEVGKPKHRCEECGHMGNDVRWTSPDPGGGICDGGDDPSADRRLCERCAYCMSEHAARRRLKSPPFT